MSITPQYTILGELTINNVYIEYDGPKVFTCQSSDVMYLAEYAEELDTSDLWLYVVISLEQKQELDNNNLSPREIFCSHNARVYLITLHHSVEIADTAINISQESIQEKWLPVQ